MLGHALCMASRLGPAPEEMVNLEAGRCLSFP